MDISRTMNSSIFLYQEIECITDRDEDDEENKTQECNHVFSFSFIHFPLHKGIESPKQDKDHSSYDSRFKEYETYKKNRPTDTHNPSVNRVDSLQAGFTDFRYVPPSPGNLLHHKVYNRKDNNIYDEI
jgi:hypothetical protein